MSVGEMIPVLTQKTLNYLPNLVLASLVVLAGYIAGKIVENISYKLISRTAVEKFYRERTYLSVSFIFSLIFKWATILYFLQYAANIAKIEALVNLTGALISIIPGVIGATAVLLGSYGIALYVKDDVFRSREFYGNILGKLTFLFILYVGITTSLELLHIPTDLLNYLLLLIVGAFAFGLAIAIGLGLKDIVKEMAENYLREYMKSQKKPAVKKKK